MEQDEAFVWVGNTPPECLYYGYQHYLGVRFFANPTASWKKIYARLGDSVNNYNINLSKGAYGQLFALIIAGNQSTYDTIKTAIMNADSSFTSDNIRSLILPHETVSFGLTLKNDALTFLHRVTLFANETDGTSYLNAPYLEILRVTPNTALAENPMTTPSERTRKTSIREQSTSSLGTLVQRLKKRHQGQIRLRLFLRVPVEDQYLDVSRRYAGPLPTRKTCWVKPATRSICSPKALCCTMTI